VLTLAVALGLAATVEQTDLDTRLRDSAAAAQVLQGPLDGCWTLWNDARRLYVFQVSDPAGGSGSLAAAWRRTGASAPLGLVDVIARQGDRLTMRFAVDRRIVRLRLQRAGRGAWTGRLNESGQDLWVALRRTASDAAP
jgi:hypothetical protein